MLLTVGHGEFIQSDISLFIVKYKVRGTRNARWIREIVSKGVKDNSMFHTLKFNIVRALDWARQSELDSEGFICQHQCFSILWTLIADTCDF